jgi:AraC-like DNA-binding protein
MPRSCSEQPYLRRQFVVAGLTLVDVSVPARFSEPAHTHAEGHFALLLDGAYEERHGFTRGTRSRLSTSYYGPGAVHGGRFGQCASRFFAVVPSEDWNRSHASRIAGWDVDTVACVPSASEVTHVLLQLRRELAHPDDLSDVAVSGLGAELVVAMSRYMRSVGKARVEHAPSWLAHTLECLRESVAGSWPTLAMLAADAGVSESELTTVFRRHIGCGVGEYLREQRLARARELLTTSTMPLTDVALAAGFYDHSHFTRHFKARTGFTPSEYRQTKGQ